MAEDHTIEIGVRGTPPKLLYSEGSLKGVKPGDRVRWICKAGDYAIQFTNSPFDPPEVWFSKKGNTSTAWYTIRAPKKRREACKYTVFVHTNSENPILMDDPVIIVDDDGEDVL